MLNYPDGMRDLPGDYDIDCPDIDGPGHEPCCAEQEFGPYGECLACGEPEPWCPKCDGSGIVDSREYPRERVWDEADAAYARRIRNPYY